MQNETVLYHVVKKHVDYVFKIHGGMMQKSGMPDVYVCHKGKQFWLELKVQRNKLSLQQKLVIKKMKRQKIPVWVLRWNMGYFILENEDGDVLLFVDLLPDIFEYCLVN